MSVTDDKLGMIQIAHHRTGFGMQDMTLPVMLQHPQACAGGMGMQADSCGAKRHGKGHIVQIDSVRANPDNSDCVQTADCRLSRI